MQTRYFLIFMVFLISMLQISIAIRVNSRDISSVEPDPKKNYPVNEDNGTEYSANLAGQLGIPGIGEILEKLKNQKTNPN